jgi:hypothetical protein
MNKPNIIIKTLSQRFHFMILPQGFYQIKSKFTSAIAKKTKPAKTAGFFSKC